MFHQCAMHSMCSYAHYMNLAITEVSCQVSKIKDMVSVKFLTHNNDVILCYFINSIKH